MRMCVVCVCVYVCGILGIQVYPVRINYFVCCVQAKETIWSGKQESISLITQIQELMGSRG